MMTNMEQHGGWDPTLERLLDEALAAPVADAGADARLSRILAATEPMVRGQAHHAGVLARFPVVRTSVLSLAATLALAVGTAAWVATVQRTDVADVVQDARPLMAVGDAIDWDAAQLVTSAPIDDQLTMLSLQFDLIGDVRDPWAAAPDEHLDAAVLREDLEMVAADPLTF